MVTDNLSWTSHVDAVVNKAPQHLFFLRWLRKFGMPMRILTNFYRCTMENIPSMCIIAWCDNCSVQDCRNLQKVVCTAQIIMEANLPSIRRRAANIIKDPSHP
eukprot:g29897.t1